MNQVKNMFKNIWGEIRNMIPYLDIFISKI